jgi:hypothetical protein
MTLVNRMLCIILTVTLSASGLSSCSSCQTTVGLNVLDTPVSEHTAVRMFFDPGNYFHPPLIFRVVAANDTRLNTAPMLPEGRTAFITAIEMQRLIKGLQGMKLSWKESREHIVFDEARNLPPVFYGISVVISSEGTAESGIPPAKICDSLAPLDSALSTPRALWEFQLFRAGFNCKVLGLDGQAYPDHWPWNGKSNNTTSPQRKE